MAQLLIRRKGFLYADANLDIIEFNTGAETEVDGYCDHFCEVTYSYPDFTLANGIDGVIATDSSAENLLAAAPYATQYYDDRDDADKNVKEANILGYVATANAFGTDFQFKSEIEEGLVIWNP